MDGRTNEREWSYAKVNKPTNKTPCTRHNFATHSYVVPFILPAKRDEGFHFLLHFDKKEDEVKRTVAILDFDSFSLSLIKITNFSLPQPNGRRYANQISYVRRTAHGGRTDKHRIAPHPGILTI